MPDFLNIEQVLINLDIKEDAMVAEFGCGSADFSLALAKKASKGRVYALDIQDEKLSALKSKLVQRHVDNVTVKLCDLEAPEGSGLQEKLLDVVVIPNVLFQAENKHAIIIEAGRVLKSQGRLLVVDWVAGSPFGPKENLALPEDVKKMASDVGLTLEKEFVSGDYHFGLLFIKP